MIRLTRYVALLAISVGITIAAAIPASAMPFPPPDPESGVPSPIIVVRHGMPLGQVVLIAACSSLLTIALVLSVRWAAAHHDPSERGLVHAA
jgi:hypothetical protein